MREIKFRAWDISSKEMLESPWGYGDGMEDGVMYINGWFKRSMIDTANPIVIMQFTGLHDKNGKEIYEGDIVHYKYLPGEGFWNSDFVGKIIWMATGFAFDSEKQFAWLVSLPGALNSLLFEVIGNIYENPEALAPTESKDAQ